MPPLRVLIVDDHESFRIAARELLIARGHEVVAEAYCAATALQALRRAAPDAVLLDVCLGAESGFEVARQLTRAAPGLPIVLMSSEGTGITTELVRHSGARAFVGKLDLTRADLEALWRG
jgi:DNA-binding NarL/FixJ family response regulator